MLRYAVMRARYGDTSTAEVLSRHPTVRSAQKALRRLSRGGEDRDLVTVDLSTSAILGRSIAVAAKADEKCRCGHDRRSHSHDGPCMDDSCPCCEWARDDRPLVVAP